MINFKDVNGKEHCLEANNIVKIIRLYVKDEIYKAQIKQFIGNDIWVDKPNFEKVQKQLKNYEETFIGMTKSTGYIANFFKKVVFFVSDIKQLIYQPNGKYHYLAKVQDFYECGKTHDIYINEEQYNYLQKRIGKNDEN